MLTENTAVLNHDALGHGYHLLKLQSLKIAPAVQPGQFVHLRVPGLGEAVLRRPFSVFKADTDSLTLPTGKSVWARAACGTCGRATR